MLLIDKYVPYVMHLEKFKSNRATKNRRRKSKVFFACTELKLSGPPSQLFKTGELQCCS